MHSRHSSALILAATVAACSTAPSTRPEWPVIDNSFIRGDKASPTAPRFGVPFGSSPKFPGFVVGSGNPDRDAEPISRKPPKYPAQCMATAAQKETIFIEFDVTPEGRVVNARIIDSTNSCFDNTAITAVGTWLYGPKTDDEGKPSWRRGVQTVMTFELAEPRPPYVPPAITAEDEGAPTCRPQKRPAFSRCPSTGTRTAPAIIEFDVSPDGYVIVPKIAESSGDRCFDYYAKEWIYSSICDPARDENGSPRWYLGNRARVTQDMGS